MIKVDSPVITVTINGHSETITAEQACALHKELCEWCDGCQCTDWGMEKCAENGHQ